MAGDISRTGLVGPAEIRTPPTAGPAVRPGTSVEQVAQEFEAMLLAQMVRQMRQSFLSEEDGGEGEGLGLGMQTMTETIDVELARALSRAGGIGLAEVIQRSMMRAAPPGMATPAQPVPAVTESLPEPVAMSTPQAAAAARPGLPEGGLRLPLDAAVSSDFGWRADPFHGQRRFHAGIDLAAAYGQDVPAAAAGRVVSAGEQGAYGLMVVVAHDNGLQTRYAHLSSLSVTPGQEIAQGTVVGRVGQSGRATGPHLHFEVLANGRRIDPALAARLTTATDGLKIPAGVDD